MTEQKSERQARFHRYSHFFQRAEGLGLSQEKTIVQIHKHVSLPTRIRDPLIRTIDVDPIVSS